MADEVGGASAGISSSSSTLLVFGYSCRLFRDDEKALYLENGGHLIPWMGDASHPIDRYDGRGAIANLALFEAPEEGFDPWEHMSPEDRRVEELCEEERYLSLHEGRSGDLADHEEGEKRGNEIGFNYDHQPQQQQQPLHQQEQEQPSLRTLANCIEKTAEFIVTHGAQMEILMRAKEANNLKFQFLNPDNPYNLIYKQVLETKRKRPKNYVSNAALMKQASLEVEKSLRVLMSELPNAAPKLAGHKSEQLQSTSGNAYSRLVERIRENQPVPPPPPLSVPAVEEVEAPVLPPHVVEVTPPPITMQPLIDKTASYVAKNGFDTMSVVKKHEPEKFAFLREDSKYNMFFQYKVALYKEMLAEKQLSSTDGIAARNGSQFAPTELSQEEQMLQVTNKFPTLKGFFR